MNNGQRTVASMLAVVAVMLGLNLIVRGSPTAVAQGPPVREPTVVAGSFTTVDGPGGFNFVRFWSDGAVDITFTDLIIEDLRTCGVIVVAECGPIVVLP